MSQKPSVGRIVHYVLDSGRNVGEHRPAIIVKAWGYPLAGLVQLQVFTDATNESPGANDALPCPLWATSVSEDPTGEKQRTWHWPEREES